MNFYVCWDGKPRYTDELNIETSLEDAKVYEYYLHLNIPTPKSKAGQCVGTFTVKEDN